MQRMVLIKKYIDEGFLSASVDLVCRITALRKLVMFNLMRLMFSFFGAHSGRLVKLVKLVK